MVGEQDRLCLCCRLLSQSPPSPVTGPACTGQAFAALLWHTWDAMRPAARTRQGSGGPGADPEPCPACLLCCQDAFGHCCWQGAPELLPARTQLTGCWHSPSGHPVPLQSPAHCQHTALHSTSQQGQQHTQTPSTPCCLPRMEALQDKMRRFGVFLVAWSVSFRKMPEEAFGRGRYSPQPVSLWQGWPGNTDSQKHHDAVLALHWIVHTHFRPGS